MRPDRERPIPAEPPRSSFPTRIDVFIHIDGCVTLKVVSVPAPTSDADLKKLSDDLNAANNQLETAVTNNPIP